MLGNKPAAAVLAVKNIEEAKEFYGDILGLTKVDEGPQGVTYKSGEMMMLVYPSEFAGTNKATALAWEVGDDFDKVMTDLKSKGVSFEHYPELPEVTMQGDVHIWDDSSAAWFKDPAGNILNIVDKM